MLTIKDFRKEFSGTTVIAVPALHLHRGVYWLRGENGSGKTTFFKALAGLLPCYGSVSFDDGTALHPNPVAYRRRVNFSEAEPLYPGFLTARELIRFVGQAKDATPQQQQHLAATFGIDQFYDKPVSTCSSGMVKKISLAMAFLGAPQLIILDEPLITLDEHARNTLFALIHDSVHQHGRTLLLSSHQAFDIPQLPLNKTFVIRNHTLVEA